MSRAFVKEEEGGRWTPPAAPRQFEVWWVGEQPGEAERVLESDDLLAALHWLAERERPGFELREGNVLLARNGTGPS